MEKAAFVYMIIVIMLVVNSFLSALHDIYLTYEISKVRPIKGFVQVVKIILFFIGSIVLIATLLDKNPLLLLSGLGDCLRC